MNIHEASIINCIVKNGLYDTFPRFYFDILLLNDALTSFCCNTVKMKLISLVEYSRKIPLNRKKIPSSFYSSWRGLIRNRFKLIRKSLDFRKYDTVTNSKRYESLFFSSSILHTELRRRRRTARSARYPMLTELIN